jgi:hypothetical protein
LDTKMRRMPNRSRFLKEERRVPPFMEINDWWTPLIRFRLHNHLGALMVEELRLGRGTAQPDRFDPTNKLKRTTLKLS